MKVATWRKAKDALELAEGCYVITRRRTLEGLSSSELKTIKIKGLTAADKVVLSEPTTLPPSKRYIYSAFFYCPRTLAEATRELSDGKYGNNPAISGKFERLLNARALESSNGVQDIPVGRKHYTRRVKLHYATLLPFLVWWDANVINAAKEEWRTEALKELHYRNWKKLWKLCDSFRRGRIIRRAYYMFHPDKENYGGLDAELAPSELFRATEQLVKEWALHELWGRKGKRTEFLRYISSALFGIDPAPTTRSSPSSSARLQPSGPRATSGARVGGSQPSQPPQP